MNYKLVLKTYAQLRQLTGDETALLNTLRGMSETERELLAETLGPAVKVKAKPTTTKRVIEKCAHFVDGGTCGLTRRAQIHKDSAMPGYHEFEQSLSSSKSKRASSLAGAIKKRTTNKEPRCVVCFEVRDHAEHDVANGGHEFEVSVATRANEVLEKYEEVESCASCHRGADENIHHLATAQGYHEFVGSETAVGVGG